MEKRKDVKIKLEHWRALRQLAVDQDMTIQAEIDAIIGTFLACTGDSKENKERSSGKKD